MKSERGCSAVRSSGALHPDLKNYAWQRMLDWSTTCSVWKMFLHYVNLRCVLTGYIIAPARCVSSWREICWQIGQIKLEHCSFFLHEDIAYILIVGPANNFLVLGLKLCPQWRKFPAEPTIEKFRISAWWSDVVVSLWRKESRSITLSSRHFSSWS